MSRHRQVNADGICVDWRLMRLLKVLWARGYRTQYSCQGGPTDDDNRIDWDGQVNCYIVFDDYVQALRFQRRTIGLLVQHVDHYWDRSLDERQKTRDNILCDTLISLTALDPSETGTIRGAVEMSWDQLDLVTHLWEEEHRG